MARILLISGSVRDRSTNTAALRTAQQVAPEGIEAVMYEGIDGLPHFNPDDDAEGKQVPEPVAAMRASVVAADALLICTPEYAGAMPAVLKNLLEWTIGDANTYQKPVAWINVSTRGPGGAADAHESLRKVLGYAHADLVADACADIPVLRDQVTHDGTIADDDVRARIAAVLARLAAHAGAVRSRE